jgi:hypothetical protein
MLLLLHRVCRRPIKLSSSSSSSSSCHQVLESPLTAKHLILSLGEKTFLSLPKRGKLVEGHCLIMPLESVVSSR